MLLGTHGVAAQVANDRLQGFRVCEIEAQGTLFKLKMLDKYPHRDERKISSRGIVTGYSQKARKRTIETMCRLDKVKVVTAKERPKFLTLTYPSNMTDHKKAMRDLDTFMKRLDRLCPEFWAVWRKELQERGAIHFHFILGNVPYIDWTWYVEAWEEIIGEESPRIKIEAIDTFGGVMHYVSKYIAKVQDETLESAENDAEGDESLLSLSMCHNSPQISTGRWWGIYGRENIPLGKRIRRRILLTIDQLGHLEDVIQSRYANHTEGYTVFCDNPYIYFTIGLGWFHENDVIFAKYRSSYRSIGARERAEVADDWLIQSELRKLRQQTSRKVSSTCKKELKKSTSHKQTTSEKLSFQTSIQLSLW